ncbi:MAG: dockerin type I domain-containing protein [Clostridiales bacterium]|nr:dockerin type I domain-containing protein [Clostridiales bacterium]
MKKNKKLLCLALAFGLVFTSGIFAFADEPQTAELGAAAVGQLNIDRVQVLNGGEVQALYRGSVYQGVPGSGTGESDSLFYTTKREINTNDPRVFDVSFTLPAEQVDDPSALLDDLALYYGGYPLSAWGNGNNLRGTTPIMRLVAKDFQLIQGDYKFHASFRVDSPYNVYNILTQYGATFKYPYLPYYSSNAAGTNSMGGGFGVWTSGPNYLGPGTYELEAVVGSETLASTSLHIGPYDGHYSWIEMNEFARELVEAIRGVPVSRADFVTELNGKPKGTLAAGYVKKAGEGRGGYSAGTAAEDVWVEVNVLAYGQMDNSKAEYNDANSYSDFNAQWNIVVAKDSSTVDAYLDTLETMKEDPKSLMGDLESGARSYDDFVTVYYQNNVHAGEMTGTENMIHLIDRLIGGGKAGKKIPYYTAKSSDVVWQIGSRWNAGGVPSGSVFYLADGLNLDRQQAFFDTGEALDKFIFVNMLCNNPDAKASMQRANRYGLDLNRDANFATQPETIAMSKDIAKWNPIVFMEWHGYSSEFMVEPCTAPHSPVYEYDLMQNNMLQLTREGAMAAMANSAYDTFQAPWDHDDFGDIDDGGSVYGPQFAMLYGTMGFTVEHPLCNQDAVEAGDTLNYGMINALMNGETAYNPHNRLNGPLPYLDGTMCPDKSGDNKYTGPGSMHKTAVWNLIEHKLRGVENRDEMSADKYFIDRRNVQLPGQAAPSSQIVVVGRPRVENPNSTGPSDKHLNFFPDYLIIPTAIGQQYNVAEAIKNLNHMMERGAKVHAVKPGQAIDYNGETYKEGTYVIDMRQANRNMVFDLMGKGYDATHFSELYADIYANFPDVRGFDSVQAWNAVAGVADIGGSGKLEPLTSLINKSAKIANVPAVPDDEAYVVFKSQSVDAVRFVNLLLSGRSSGPSFAGMGDVWMLRNNLPGVENGEVGTKSDYVIKYKELEKLDKLAMNTDLGLPHGGEIIGEYFAEMPDCAEPLVEPIISFNTARTRNGGGALWWAFDEYLGFNMRNPDGTDYNGSSASTARAGANVVVMYNAAPSGTLLTAIKEQKLGTVLIQNAAVLTNANFGTGNTAAPSTATLGDVGLNGNYNEDDSLFTANYELTDTIYARGTAWTGANMPAGSKILFRTLENGEDAFIGGFQNTGGSKTAFGNRILAFSTLLKGGGIEGKPVQVLAIGQNMSYRPHYQKLYPMMATAIFAGAAGILDDFVAPELNGVAGGKHPGGVEMTLVAEDDPNGSGIEKYTFYKWAGSDYAFVAEQASSTYDFSGLAANAFFKAVITDWAGNETTKWIEYKYATDEFVIYDEDPLAGVLRFSVLGEKTGFINQDVEFTIAARNASDVLTVNATFEIDGGLLAFKGIEGLNGFDTVGGISWRSMGGEVWRGTVTMGYPDSGTETGTGFNSTPYADIAKLTFAPRAAADVSVTLYRIERVTGKVDLNVVDVEAFIESGVATTTIELLYSKYDLNRDGTVDALDLAMVLLYCGWDSDSPDWDTEIKVYDSHGKGVTAKTCDVNSDGMVDMLDLLDLFIHYTK